MSTSILRVTVLFSALFAAGTLVAACGGKISGVGVDGDGGVTGDTGTFVGPDGATCVDIDPASYETSCTTSADCILIKTGDVCSGDCLCGATLVNKSGQARYSAATSSITPALCECILPGEPACVHGSCELVCAGPESPGSCSDAGGPGASDAGAPPDAPTCVDIQLASYDTSCTEASDCVFVQSGEVCDGTCGCGDALINKASDAAYESAISGIRLEPCGCPDPGQAACVHGACTLCGPASAAGCPDAG